MNKKQIEELSVNAVIKSLSLTGYLSPYISTNDKEPSWDGSVYIYSNKNGKKEDITGKVSVQVKGKSCSNFSKSEIMFPVDIIDLRNYLNDGGVIYFVVYLKKNGSEKIYYSTLTPVKLNRYLKNIETQKTKSIKFKEFPKDNNKKMDVFVNFYENSKRQRSFTETGFISLDELNREIVQEFTMTITGHGFKSEKPDITSFLAENDEIYLYAKIKGSSALHPIDTIITSITSVSLPEDVQEAISINGKVYYPSFTRTLFKEKVEIKIGESLLITILRDDMSTKVSYESSKMLRTRVKDLDFFLNAIKAKHFSINKSKLAFEIPTDEALNFNIEREDKSLAYYKKVLQLLNILNVSEDIDIEKLTKQDYKNIDILIKAFIENQPVKNLQKGLMVLKLKISNISLMLFFVKSENYETTYEIKDFFNSGMMFAYKDEDGHMHSAPAYSFLRKDDYLKVSNINLDDILPSYRALQDLNNRIFEIANQDMLQLLLAYDESEPKKDKLLLTAKNIAEWILNEDTDNLPVEIKILNFLQITKRERKLNSEEKQKLISISQNSSSRIDVKVASYLLLDNNELAEFHFNQLPQEDQDGFKSFPIYYFWNLTS